MAKAPRGSTTVEINVYGDAVNSTIVGIQVGARQIRSDDRVFQKVLFEYLGLPTLKELAAKIDVGVARRRGRIREFDFSRSSALLRLWQGVLRDRYGFAGPSTFMLDSYDGRLGPKGDSDWAETEAALPIKTWIRLKNVQISSFVNRAPGKFFLGGWRFRTGHDEVEEERFVVSQQMWTWEDYAVRTMGIGDVRLGSVEDFAILQLGCPVGSATSPTDAGGAALSPLGFPILVERLLYNRLKPTLETYGAAHVTEITAQLVPVAEETGLLWAPGVPKSILVAVDRSGMSSPAAPGRSFGSAWTVAANEDRKQFHYCTWGFELGTKTYRANLKQAVQTIAKAMDKRQLSALFEFDAEQNWFSDSTDFGPAQIEALAKKIKTQERLRMEISLNDIDAGADHTIADALGHNVDPNEMERLSRAFRFMQLGYVESSLAIADSLLQDSPKNPFALFVKGASLFYLDRAKDAKQVLNKALKARPSYQLHERIAHTIQLIDQKESGHD
jgi:hypothetical protein